MYHVVSRVGERLVREAVGHNRKEAERGSGHRGARSTSERTPPPENVGFSEWAIDGLPSLRREETTRRTYGSSLEYAKEVIGKKPLRKVTTDGCPGGSCEHVERVNRARKPPREVSSTTLAKHLRHLGACLQAAKAERLIAENPVRLLASSAKPKAVKKRPSYFTNDELAGCGRNSRDRP